MLRFHRPRIYTLVIKLYRKFMLEKLVEVKNRVSSAVRYGLDMSVCDTWNNQYFTEPDIILLNTYV